MTYDEICQYVFEEEGVSWDMRLSRKRDRGLVIARQISIYIGNWFHPRLTWSFLGEPFKRDHATAIHAVRTINDLMEFDKTLRAKIFGYLDYVREKSKKDAESEVMKTLQDRRNIEAVLELVSKMELVAKVYCEITDKRIIDK